MATQHCQLMAQQHCQLMAQQYNLDGKLISFPPAEPE